MEGNRGNPNPIQTGAFKEAAEANQFQPGNQLQKLGRPWSIRQAMRYFAAQEVDDNGKLPGRKNPTAAEAIALKTLEKAMEGEARHIEIAITNIDGKVVQPNLNAYVAHLEAMTDEELDAEITRLQSGLHSPPVVS